MVLNVKVTIFYYCTFYIWNRRETVVLCARAENVKLQWISICICSIKVRTKRHSENVLPSNIKYKYSELCILWYNCKPVAGGLTWCVVDSWENQDTLFIRFYICVIVIEYVPILLVVRCMHNFFVLCLVYSILLLLPYVWCMHSMEKCLYQLLERVCMNSI